MPLHKYFTPALSLLLTLSCSFSTAENLDSEQLEYYLMQSFSSSSFAQRIPLNHIGVEVERLNGNYIVSASLEGYPAHGAGLERGDIIYNVDGQPYHPINSFNSTVDGGRFTASSEIFTIEFERAGNKYSVELTSVFENLYDSYRSAVENSVLKFSSGNKVIGYVRLWGFSRSTNDFISLEKVLSEFDDCDGLILDLRNSFGFLSNSHLNLFLARTDADNASISSLPESIPFSHEIDYFTRPIAILLNEQTRGGGELLAGALDFRERIMSIGQPSAGRPGHYIINPVQQSELLYIPPGDSGDAAGSSESAVITPEYLADYPITLNTRSDPQYESAVSFLLGAI